MEKRVNGCEDCPLKGNEKVFGEGPDNTDLVLVGEAPGATEVKEGKPFVGAAGRILDRALERVGIERDKIYITNAVLCRPPSNRTPTSTEILHCRERLKRSILKRNPKLIVVMGNASYYAIFPEGRMGGVLKRRGLFFHSDEFGCKVLVTVHPAAVLRDATLYSLLVKDLEKAVKYISTDLSSLGKREYVLLSTRVEVLNLLEELKRRKIFSFDIETTGLNPWKDKVLSYAFSFKERQAYCVFTNERLETWTDEEWNFLEGKIKEVLEDPSSKLIIQNAMFEIPFLKVTKGWDIHCYFDTMLAHYLLDENAKGQHGLKRLATRFPDLVDYANEVDVTQLKYIDNERFVNYTCSDADATWRLYKIFSKQLKEEGLEWLFRNITMPLTYVLSMMMVRGIKVDTKLLGELKRKYEKELEEIIDWVRDKYGDINLASPTQLRDLLYNKLGLPVLRKTVSNQPSTDDATLKQLIEGADDTKKELLQRVLRFRKLMKLYKTYVVGIAKRLNPVTKRLHTEFLIHGTRTGRLSSINPNLQNIAGEKDIKNLFIAEEGMKLVEADYRQLEFRVFMNYVGDQKAFEDLAKGFDVHRMVASRVLNKPYEEITEEERKTAKGVVFGLLYGMATETLANAYNIPLKEAERFVRNFWMMYPKAKMWWDDLRARLRKTGYVTNLYGRKRRLPNIFSQETSLVASALRQGINAPVQGGAADITNFALIRIYKYLETRNYRARPLLQIHDSIVLEVPDEEVEELVPIIEKLMTKDIPGVKVPLEVDIQVVKRWGEET